VILYSHDVSSIQNDSQYLEEDFFEKDKDEEAELLSHLLTQERLVTHNISYQNDEGNE
jgi:hypothetical protein